MKRCKCRIMCSSGRFLFNPGNTYNYETYLLKASQIFKMYKVYIDNDYTHFVEFDFDQYFINENEIRTEKLKKLNNENR